MPGVFLLPGLNQLKGIDPVVPMLQYGITKGTADQKREGAQCYADLLRLVDSKFVTRCRNVFSAATSAERCLPIQVHPESRHQNHRAINSYHDRSVGTLHTRGSHEFKKFAI